MMNYQRISLLCLLAIICFCVDRTEAVDVPATDTMVNQRKNPAMTQEDAGLQQQQQQQIEQIAQRLSGVENFDERISDLISLNVLRFAHALGQELYLANGQQNKNEIFSPLSLMSSLSMLLLGARGKTYDELKRWFGIDYDTELHYNTKRFHEEFGYMLEDLKQNDGYSVRSRSKVNWRVNSNVRYKPMVERNNKPFEHIIKVANGLFVQQKYNINPNYKEVVQDIYRAQFNDLDFELRPIEARNFINSWVHDATNGKIAEIISEGFPRSTNMILASALYFKGFWENSFIQAATSEDNFFIEGPHAAPKRVQMMATGGVFPYYDAPEYGCRILGLPYRGNLTTMYIIQPYFSTRIDLAKIQRSLDADKIGSMISKMSQKTAVLVMPKMHFVSSINLRNILMRMGLSSVFTPGQSDLSLIGEQLQYLTPQSANTEFATAVPSMANSPQSTTMKEQEVTLTDRFNEAPLIFSRFADDDLSTSHRFKRATTRGKLALDALEQQRLATHAVKADMFVDEVLHKVDFTINEQGTEAAAATLTYLRRSGTDIIFRVDSPFLFLIRHDPTKLPLFYGMITEPEL